jgi:hypothetical protein
VSIKNQVSSLTLEVGATTVTIDNDMAVTQVQIGKNIIEDVLFDGGLKLISSPKQLRLRLGLPKLKPTPYNLRITDQTTTKPMGLIRDLTIYVHDILYITTFIVLHNKVVDFSYSMLLGRPWLKDAKAAHDWGSTLLPYKGMG